MIAVLIPALFIIPSIVVILGLIFWGARVQAKKNRDELTAFAQQAGLRMMERTVLGFKLVESLEGEQQGRAIRYWSFVTGSGKTAKTWVAVGVRPATTAGLQFELTRQNFGSKILELFGAKEIRVGDPLFDEAWFVRTNQPEFFAAALGPQIRSRFMAEPTGRSGVRYQLEKDLVQYVELGRLSERETVERLESQLPLLHELADVAEVFAAPSR